MSAPSPPRFSVHWLTMTSTDPLEEVLARSETAWGVPESSGGFGHPNRVSDENGVTVFFGSRAEGQPLVIVASGQVLERVELQRILRLGRWVTRVDLAADLDVEDSASLVRAVRDDARSGVLKCPFRNRALYESDGERAGLTAYLGSRKSDLFLRVYNERGPVRFEWSWKLTRTLSDQVVPLLRDGKVASLWRGLAAGIEWPREEWRVLTRGEAVAVSERQQVVTDWERVIVGIRAQYGLVLGLLRAAGVTLDDLVVDRVPSAAVVNRLVRLASSIPEGPHREHARNFVQDLRQRRLHCGGGARSTGRVPVGVAGA